MGRQYVGSVLVNSEPATLMLCTDADRPTEVTIHLWGDHIKAAAALAKRIEGDDNNFVLALDTVYDIDDGGGLRPALPTSPDGEYVRGVRVTLSRSAVGYAGKWEDNRGGQGTVQFQLMTDDGELTPTLCSTWDDFKGWANRMRRDKGISAYRGHGSNQFRLKTTLHRAGRTRLERYCNETLPAFKAHAEMVLGTRFNMNDPDDYSVVLGLAQHHGLPTPLLDWTESPYIAAFFAFSDALDHYAARPDETHVRVYGLTREYLVSHTSNIVTLPFIRPYVVPLAISPRHNPRLYAQQGLFLATNVINVENYLIQLGKHAGREHVVAADIPIDIAHEALEDLAYMGLTAATMFPGLDGVCRMMRHAMSFRREPNPPPGKPAGNVEV